MSPEERAKSVALALRGGSHQRPMPIIASVSQISLIAQAIREAEDAAIEDAAAAASGSALRAVDAGYDRETTAIAIVTAIRSLKSKD